MSIILAENVWETVPEDGARVGEQLILPLNAGTQVVAFMGRRGSGKSYGAGRLVEQLHAAGTQIVVIDPVGVWWGLRLAADGKAPGLQIPVFGGHHGDIAIDDKDVTAEKLGEIAAARRQSMILDVSGLLKGAQKSFVASFLETFYRTKQKHRSAVHVVIDEAQVFCPQHVMKDSARVTGAVLTVFQLGRNVGIGGSLLSQRPQAVNKGALNQAEMLVCGQLVGPQERKAIEGWVQEKGQSDREIGNTLPSLKVGEPVIWSPQWLGIYGRYRILPKWTFDSSATPDFANNPSMALDVEVPPMSLDELRSTIEGTGEKLKKVGRDKLKEANLPTNGVEVGAIDEFVERTSAIAHDLSGYFATAGHLMSSKTSTDDITIRMVDRSIRLLGEKTRLREALMNAEIELSVVRDRIDSTIATIVQALVDCPRETEEPPKGDGNAWTQHLTREVEKLQQETKGEPKTEARTPKGTRTEHGKLSACERAILAVFLGHEGQPTIARTDLAVWTGYKHSGGGFLNSISHLNTLALLSTYQGACTMVARLPPDVRIQVTPDSCTALRVVARWENALPTNAGRMLHYIFAETGLRSPKPVTKSRLAALVGMQPGGGGFLNYISLLSGRKLIKKQGAGYVISEHVMRAG